MHKSPGISDPAEVRRVDYIEKLTLFEIGLLKRFAPMGHPFFIEGSMENTILEYRFKTLGGMTPKLSKQLGMTLTKQAETLIAHTLSLYEGRKSTKIEFDRQLGEIL